MREAVRLDGPNQRLSMRELARRTGINSGRLSIIERGVEPTDDERRILNTVLGSLLTEADA